MNSDLIPAVVAAGGGGALLGSIYLYEQRRLAAMREGRQRYVVRFPRGLDPLAAEQALSQLAGLPDYAELVAETVVTEDGVQFVLAIPAQVSSSVIGTLTSTLPGLRMERAAELSGYASLGLRLFVPTPVVLRTGDAETAARSLLGGLGGVRNGESVVIRWTLLPTTPRPREAKEQLSRRERQIEAAWERKTSGSGFMAAGLVLVRTVSRARARELGTHIQNVLGARRDLTGGIRVTSERAGRSMMSAPKTGRWSGWCSSQELLPLLAWPVGEERYPGVTPGGARQLIVPSAMSRDGRVVVIGTDASGPRPVAVSESGALQHQAVIGPSGSGKSTLLATNLISDLERGAGGILIDPKGPELVNAVADRVPRAHAHRVVVLDPAQSGPVPGVDVFGSGDPELASDVILGAFARIFKDSWGIYSQLYGQLTLRSLAAVGGKLTDVGRLFTDRELRQEAIKRLDDPLLASAWARYEQLSPAEAGSHAAPFVTKATNLLSRPAVRRVLASDNPKLDISRLLAERRWLLISLSPGQLGEASLQLIGSVLLYLVWSAIEGRAGLSESARPRAYLYVDELTTLAGLPFSFEVLAERSRGFNVGLVVAAQSLARVPESVRASLLGNVATLLSFRAAAGDARTLAAEMPGLKPDDLVALGAFELAARLGTGAGGATTTVTGSAPPPLPRSGQLRAIRTASVAKYGSPLSERKPEARAAEASFKRTRRDA
jgi:hypothetical protein